MVLRRQYRHLREELAKLKVPEGLNDLDAPFNPNVTLPAMNESGATGNNNSSGTIAITKSNSEIATSVTTTTTASVGSSSGANILAESTKSSGILEIATSATNTHQEKESQSLGTTTFTPLEINTNQPLLNCNIDDDNDDSPTIPSQSTLPSNTKDKVVADEEPILFNNIDVGENEGDGEDDVIVTEGDELDVSDYKCNTVDELMEQLFFDNSENAMHYDD